MGKIVDFRTPAIAPMMVRSGKMHRVSIEILDTVRPRRTRWAIQFEVQEAAGIPANKGLTDKAVAAGYRHRFEVTSTRALRQFVAETSELVADQKVAVWVDGSRVRTMVARRA